MGSDSKGIAARVQLAKKDNQEAINKIIESQTVRFENYRNTIKNAKNILGNAEVQPKDKQKTELILKLKQNLMF